MAQIPNSFPLHRVSRIHPGNDRLPNITVFSVAGLQDAPHYISFTNIYSEGSLDTFSIDYIVVNSSIYNIPVVPTSTTSSAHSSGTASAITSSVSATWTPNYSEAHAGVIAGAVVGSLIVVAAFVILLMFLRRRRKSHRSHMDLASSTSPSEKTSPCPFGFNVDRFTSPLRRITPSAGVLKHMSSWQTAASGESFWRTPRKHRCHQRLESGVTIAEAPEPKFSMPSDPLPPLPQAYRPYVPHESSVYPQSVSSESHTPAAASFRDLFFGTKPSATSDSPRSNDGTNGTRESGTTESTARGLAARLNRMSGKTTKSTKTIKTAKTGQTAHSKRSLRSPKYLHPFANPLASPAIRPARPVTLLNTRGTAFDGLQSPALSDVLEGRTPIAESRSSRQQVGTPTIVSEKGSVHEGFEAPSSDASVHHLPFDPPIQETEGDVPVRADAPSILQGDSEDDIADTPSETMIPRPTPGKRRCAPAPSSENRSSRDALQPDTPAPYDDFGSPLPQIAERDGTPRRVPVPPLDLRGPVPRLASSPYAPSPSLRTNRSPWKQGAGGSPGTPRGEWKYI